MNVRNEFIAWYFNEFKETCNSRVYGNVLFLTPKDKTMLQTVEDSTWHREANVSVHTDMVVSQYISRAKEEWNRNDIIGALVCAFHDVGKPYAEEVLQRADGTEYRRYAAHELVSARLFEHYMMSNPSLMKRFNLQPTDLYAIGWLIENHLPYGLKKTHKREGLYRTTEFVADFHIFRRILYSDCWGRISDDHETKKANTNAWLTELWQEAYNNMWIKPRAEVDGPELVMLIGPSNCGKSTWLKNNSLLDDHHYYSWDALRLDWYSSDYTEAFKLSTADKEFGAKTQKVFMNMIHTKESIVVDNTNLSAKRRAFFINTARQHGYKVRAELFPISLSEIVGRALMRTDQIVPEFAVRRQYLALSLPGLGEVDDVNVHPYFNEV